MPTDKQQLNRAGLLNFWYYDNEIFDFADGKLLLRGSNGCGKSVTMQSLLPVLLDGRKSPDRLDPFGSRARRMEDYLLGEAGISQRDERTGYLWLEYKRSKSERYITTGIGLRARRNSPMDFWGFIILDDRRIGYDLELHRREYSPELGKEVLAPLTRTELTNRLEPGGRVVRRQQEYMELVNRHLFGFESIESYEDLIKLLIQLRSPKLSKDFKPTVIYEILNESIPALSDDELRPLSETIENMDRVKQQLEQLERDRGSLKKLSTAYDAYNRYMLAEKAKGVLDSIAGREDLNRAQEKLEQDLHRHRRQLQEDRQRLTALEQEEKVLEQERDELQDHDVFRAEKQLKEAEDSQNTLNLSQEMKAADLIKKQSRERHLEKEEREQQAVMVQLEREQAAKLDQLEMLAEKASFAGHDSAAQDYRRRQADYDFSLWQEETGQYSQVLETILAAARKYEQELDRYRFAETDYAFASKQLDELTCQRNQLEQEQDSLKEQWLNQFHQWDVACRELALSPEEKQLTARRLLDIFEIHKPSLVLQPVDLAQQRAREAINEDVAQKDGLLHAKNMEIKEIQAQLQEWKQRQEPEPLRHPDTSQARCALQEAGIPFVPFYGAVEFREDVSPEQRERLEAAIAQVGLLDALIVPAEHLPAIQGWDKVILPNPRILEHTLADVLEPVSGLAVDVQTIDNVLRSILMGAARMEPGDASIDARGNYRISILSGQAPREKAQFIGKEARRRYRLRKIAELEQVLAGLNAEVEQINTRKDMLNQRLNTLQREFEDLPAFGLLEENWESIREVDQNLKVHRADAETKKMRLDKVHAKMQSARGQLQILARELNLPESNEAYATAAKDMSIYASQLGELEMIHLRICHCRELSGRLAADLEDIRQSVDSLKGELNTIDIQLRQLALSIEKIRERMQALGAEEIRARVQTVVQRLIQVPQEHRETFQRTVNLDRDIRDWEQELKGTAQRLEEANTICACWQEYFIQELNYRFVLDADPGDREAIPALARRVLKDYGHLLNSTDRQRVTTRLDKAFYEESQYLVEYRPDMVEQTMPGELPPAGSQWLETQLFALNQARHRQIIMLDYSGQKKDVYLVLDKMEEDIALQQQLLSEKDRELYEEIILHSVGDIIRHRISRAERWVEEINKLMEQRDTSSGLTFSLRWKPRTADHEEELDTAELVDLLRKDPNLLKEEDMTLISRHFRSKIDRAKAELADREQGETFHSIVRELLDYRTWFDFKLFFRKGQENKRELTNTMFFTFSGGEKAMAMYIPLFSAVYSRYQEARPDAPHLISLDEAFAGVDETNIRDMFDLMEKLGFNYIINSQSLWGDYDTAGRLSICELVRPKNVPWVTVIRYLWDGKTRRLLSSQAAAARE